MIDIDIDMSLGSANMIIKKDLRLKCLRKTKAQSLTDGNKLARFNRCRHPLQRYPASMVNFIWFTVKKLFTVEMPRNTQNNHIYAPVGIHKKDEIFYLTDTGSRVCTERATTTRLSVNTSSNINFFSKVFLHC